MPLSEHEQRLLEEMERSLYNNDADFVATVNPRGARPNYRRIALGALIALVGIIAIVVGIMIKQPLVGLLGFIVILGGALLALSAPRSRTPSTPSGLGETGPSSASGKTRAGGGFMDRMNERWDRRQDGRDE
ncbi:MAG: DUF3040 domain-containing protein [Homoserinimonas sp.]